MTAIDKGNEPEGSQ